MYTSHPLRPVGIDHTRARWIFAGAVGIEALLRLICLVSVSSDMRTRVERRVCVWGEMAVNRDLLGPPPGYSGIFWDILAYFGLMFFQQDLLKSEGRRDADLRIKTWPDLEV